MRALPSAAITLLLAACTCPNKKAATDQEDQADQILRAALYIKADYDRVWERFTSAPAYADWYSAPCREFGEAPGDPIIWGNADRDFYHGTLRYMDKGRGLSHSIKFVGFDFDEPPTPVEIEILEQGDTVLVSLRHDCQGAPRTYEMISPVGWMKSLSRLKTLLETGAPMPWPGEMGGSGGGE
jgi:hypothetical protein